MGLGSQWQLAAARAGAAVRAAGGAAGRAGNTAGRARRAPVTQLEAGSTHEERVTCGLLLLQEPQRSYIGLPLGLGPLCGVCQAQVQAPVYALAEWGRESQRQS
mmetsp:Transcript_18847/g.47795  ORF Transcript_18847/g.47795 Transcript_18847/m.47795 type:complete len:104 (+) Transcript_18847:227-538(+)